MLRNLQCVRLSRIPCSEPQKYVYASICMHRQRIPLSSRCAGASRAQCLCTSMHAHTHAHRAHKASQLRLRHGRHGDDDDVVAALRSGPRLSAGAEHWCMTLKMIMLEYNYNIIHNVRARIVMSRVRARVRSRVECAFVLPRLTCKRSRPLCAHNAQTVERPSSSVAAAAANAVAAAAAAHHPNAVHL